MRRYGIFFLQKERLEWCIAETCKRWPHYRQCTRKRGHGPDGLYCKQHAKMLAQGKFVPAGREEEK